MTTESPKKRAGAKRKIESYLTVADDLQRLAMGKILAVGLYPDRVILMHGAENASPDAAMSKLALMLAIRGLPAGEHDATTTLTFPDGSGQTNSNPVQVVVPQDGDGVTLLMVFSPFPVPAFGTFTLSVKIAGELVEESFTILQRDLTHTLAELATRPQEIVEPARLDIATPGEREARKAKAPAKPQKGVASKKPAPRKVRASANVGSYVGTKSKTGR